MSGADVVFWFVWAGGLILAVAIVIAAWRDKREEK